MIFSLENIPIIYNENYGYIIRFNDVEALSEEYCIDYIDSMLAIAEVNGIDPNYLAVAVNESDIILNYKIANELKNIVIIPISENNIIYQFYEDCIDAFLESGDIKYLSLIENSNKAVNIIKKLGREKQTHIAKFAFNTRRVHENDNSRINIFTGNINYLHENNLLKFDIRDFVGPDKEKRMKKRIELTAKKIIDKNTKSIAQKIAALRKLGDQLKGKEEKTYDLEKKGRIQIAFDTIKNKARELLNKITPSFLK